MPTSASAWRQGTATASIAERRARRTRRTSHAGSASSSDERTLSHCWAIARTTNTPPATAITMPIAVEILARRARFSRCLLRRAIRTRREATVGPGDVAVPPRRVGSSPQTLPRPALPPRASPFRVNPSGVKPCPESKRECESKPGSRPVKRGPKRGAKAGDGRVEPEVADGPARLNLVVVRGECSGPPELRELESGRRLAAISVRAPGTGRSGDVGAGHGLGARGLGRGAGRGRGRHRRRRGAAPVLPHRGRWRGARVDVEAAFIGPRRPTPAARRRAAPHPGDPRCPARLVGSRRAASR